jgi:MFS family permease
VDPSVPPYNDADGRPWPPRDAAGGARRHDPNAEQQRTVDRPGIDRPGDEQPTSQLPRRPDAARFPYPAPQPPGGEVGNDEQPTDPNFDASSFRTGQPDPRYRPQSPPRYESARPSQHQPQNQPQNQPQYQPPPRGSHLPPYDEPFRKRPDTTPPSPRGTDAMTAGPAAGATAGAAATGVPGVDPAAGAPTAPRTGPRKLTVTRVAAFRSRELTTRGVQIFQRAAAADGADRSGLTNLTYAVMGNYAVDAALAVALANTLFFAAATAESTSKVLLYLLITVAPFAVIAPLIGPALDKLQHGRRIALAASSFARALLAVVMALNFDSWVLYPCALGMLVLSKSFSVLKAAITPRVLPPDITLVKTNSRLTVFGLIAGGVAGAVAAALSWAFGSTGALIFTALLSIVGGWLCLRIPAWVESTAGEIPVDGVGPKAKRAFPLSVTTTLWANGTIRVETGFLALFIAFVIKSEYTGSSGFTQLLLLGVVGAAAGIGGFVGNGLGARLTLNKPETVSILSLSATVVATLTAVLIPGLATAALVGLVGSTASSLAKVCLDSVIQHELPEASRASAFGLSETVLQLSWVSGGVVGLLIGGVWSFGHDSVYSIGFAVITVVLLIGLTQSWLVRSGKSLFPWLDYSRLTRHFRRSGKHGATARDAGQPLGTPPTTHAPWQGPPSGHQAGPGWPPPGQQPPSTQQWAGPPSPSSGAWAPGPPTRYIPPPAGAPPAGPPPARDAGARRKWNKP